MFLRLLTGFWCLCLAYILTVVSKVLLNVRYRPFTHSQSHAHLVLYASDPGDTMIVVTSGLSFKNLPLQQYFTLRSCTLGCWCCLGLGMLSRALEMCHFSEYWAYYYYIYLFFLDLLGFSTIFSCVYVDQ